MKKFKIGEKVTYKPENEKGRVYSLVQDKAYVVYNCNNDWRNYRKYTPVYTRLCDLKRGWEENRLENFIKRTKNKLKTSLNLLHLIVLPLYSILFILPIELFLSWLEALIDRNRPVEIICKSYPLNNLEDYYIKKVKSIFTKINCIDISDCFFKNKKEMEDFGKELDNEINKK